MEGEGSCTSKASWLNREASPKHRLYIVLISFGTSWVRPCPLPQTLLCLRTKQLASEGRRLFSGMLLIAAKVWDFVPSTVKE